MTPTNVESPLSPEAALEHIELATSTLASEQVELERSIGRVLACDVIADAPSPRFTNSAMDGFAVIASDTIGATKDSPITLELIGESRAGCPAADVVTPGQAVAISTGAVLPDGADAVVRVEDTVTEGRQIVIRREVTAGCDIRQVGEDYQVSDVLIDRGRRVGAAEIGVLASLGLESVECVRRPRVSVITTGDELSQPGSELAVGGIYNSNRYSIAALVELAGAEVASVSVANDSADSVRAAIAAALENDLVVLCGGVSMGEHDHVKQALAELGVSEGFWRVAQRPGGPLWFGTYRGGGRSNTLVFGLPGNPVSAMVTFYIYVRHAIALQLGANDEGRRVIARLDGEIVKSAGKTAFIRVALKTDSEGVLHAKVTGPQGSHVTTSMLHADAFAIIPPDCERVVAGEPLEVELLR